MWSRIPKQVFYERGKGPAVRRENGRQHVQKGPNLALNKKKEKIKKKGNGALRALPERGVKGGGAMGKADPNCVLVLPVMAMERKEIM